MHALRSTLLRVWQWAERGLDRAFGAQANPLRHLGALGFFLFWIVAVSGVYLYIFYDTGAQAAYRSVEALTHDQRFAGGVIRSLHRYASDAFALVAILHLIKELLHGRYAGFRWFSWLTGVPLIWLMFASGISGYWLVWDELAQFTAVATTEWLDSLDIFGEPLVRNFLTNESINDRFFTLMVFLHIGIPLALLLGMFVHIQRVNYADVTPRRALSWGVFVTLILLAALLPATSLPPADLSQLPVLQSLDWFYLLLYPLIYAWSPAAVWALAGGMTAWLALLPLLGHRRPEPVAKVDIGNCNGCARCFADCPYGAVIMQQRIGAANGALHAVVLPELCASCGICAGACPSSTPFRSGDELVTGIDMPQRSIQQLRVQLETALNASQADIRIVMFACDQGVGIDRLELPGVSTHGLICASQLPPSFIEYALRCGADGIFVATCREGDCAYRLGEQWLRQRFADQRVPHLRANVPRQRIRICGLGKGEESAMMGELKQFENYLRGLPTARPAPPARGSKKPVTRPV